MRYKSTIITVILTLFFIGFSYQVVSGNIKSNNKISSSLPKTERELEASMNSCGNYNFGPIYVPYITEYSTGSNEVTIAIIDYNSAISTAQPSVQSKLNAELSTYGYSTINIQPATISTPLVIPVGFSQADSALTGVYPSLYGGSTYQGVKIDAQKFTDYFGDSGTYGPINFPSNKLPNSEMLFFVYELVDGSKQPGGMTDIGQGFIILTTTLTGIGKIDTWLHEIGHSLGLDHHNVNPSNIMIDELQSSPGTFYPQQACVLTARVCNSQVKTLVLGIIPNFGLQDSTCGNGQMGYQEAGFIEECENNIMGFQQPCLDCTQKPVPQVPPNGPNVLICGNNCRCHPKYNNPPPGSKTGWTSGVDVTSPREPPTPKCDGKKCEKGEQCGDPGCGVCTGANVKCINCKCVPPPKTGSELCDNDPKPGCQNPKFMQICGQSKQEDGTIIYAYCDYDCGCKYGI